MKHIVGFSGGADSQATSLWCRERFPPEDVILLNTNAGGNEHPLTEWFIAEYSATVHPVITVPSLVKDLGNVGTRNGAIRDRRREFSDDDELTFDVLAYIKGHFPSRKAQFCTEYLKLAPQLRWINENIRGKYDFRRYVGVRRDESAVRRSCPDETWDSYFSCTVLYPIADWTKVQVFDYLKAAGEDVNPLYRMGFSRVGCAPCVNAAKEDIRGWATRAPQMIDKVRRWEQRVGRTFFHPTIAPAPPEYRRALAAWREEWLVEAGPECLTDDGEPEKIVRDGAPPPPDVPLMWIDDVVRWSRTARGGRQMELPMFEAEAESGVCVSKYGLCE